MGDVWKARDTRLDRSVAIKLSKSKFSDRFHSEARAVAALNHPNICTLHDVGPDYLVMEYIDGVPLAGPLPPAKALPLAVQILDALDAAHKKGIVHRDLKPGNILVTKQGVKLLDFGLATKAPSTVTPDAPTQTALDTGSEIAGTLQYMSPEQLQGKPVDARSDLFAFGAVLYELLAGRRAFTGENPAAIIAAILERDPAPLGTPFDKVIATCLAKDPDHRFQSATDTKRALEWALDAPAKQPAAPAKRWPLVLAATATCIAAAALFYAFRPVPPKEPTPIIAVTRDGRSTSPAVSPDGKLIAFTSFRDDENYDIYLQQSNGRAPVRLTNDPAPDFRPVFSADGSRIYFTSLRTPLGVYEIAALGGDARLVVPQAVYAAESPDGKWLAYAAAGSIWLRPIGGGEPRNLAPYRSESVPLLWSPDSSRIFIPYFDKSQIYHLASATLQPVEPAVIGSLRQRQMLIVGATQFLQWLPDDELLVTAPNGDAANLWRVPMGRRAGQPPIPVTIAPVRRLHWAHTAGGRLIFDSSAGTNSLVRLPADLKAGRVLGPPRPVFSSQIDVFNPDVTPDGRTLVYCSHRDGPAGIWVVDLATGKERRLVIGTAHDRGYAHSAISPDGKWVAAMYDGTVIIPVDGGPAREISKQPFRVRGWTPDGRLLLVWSTKLDDPISVLDPETGALTPIIRPGAERVSQPRLSRDGKWIAFVGSSGTVYLAPFRGAAEILANEWIAVARGGTLPFWSPDANSIHYVTSIDRGSSKTSVLRQPLDPVTKRPSGKVSVLHETNVGGVSGAVSHSIAVSPTEIFILLWDVPMDIWSMDFTP